MLRSIWRWTPLARKNRTISDTWRWGLYLVIGVLFMVGVVVSSWQALHATEARFCQILDFVKSQSTSFEKYNDTVVAKTLRRTAVSVHQLAQDPTLDLSDPQCRTGRQSCSGSQVFQFCLRTVRSCANPQRTASAMPGLESSSNDAVLDVFSYPQKTYRSGSCWRTGLPWMLRHTGQKAKRSSCLPTAIPRQNL